MMLAPTSPTTTSPTTTSPTTTNPTVVCPMTAGLIVACPEACPVLACRILIGSGVMTRPSPPAPPLTCWE
jgi:hypothetical protein